MQTASSAKRTARLSRSASENTPTLGMPNSLQARMMRTAISPRLATRTFLNKPAIDGQDLAGDVSRPVRCQEADGSRDFRGGTGATHRYLLENGRLRFLRDIVPDSARNVARSNSVNGDVAVGNLSRQALGQADHSRFSRRIVGLPRIADEAGNRADVDDATPALTEHRTQRGPGAEEGTLEVGVQNGIPIFFGHPQRQAIASDASVIDQNVQPAELLERKVGKRLRPFDGTDVGGEGSALDIPSEGFGGSGIAVVIQNDFRAHSSKLPRRRGAKRTGCPGDDGDAVSQRVHVGWAGR